ncbi:MAG: choice-of-anchor K domain-containing protein [Verrucomicrobiales bacterium]
MLAIVSAVAIISSLAVVAISNSSQSVKQTKLEQDVSQLNSAVQVLLSSGASMDGTETAQDVLTELKKEAAGTGQKTVVGLRGSAIDPRLEAFSETNGESRQRAMWNATDNKFVLVDGKSGIREFRLNEALGKVDYGSAERNTRLVYNATEGWVWNSRDFTYGFNQGPSEVGVVDQGALGTIGGIAGANGTKLGTPIISPDSGYHALSTFPLQVTITKQPTDPDDAKIYYSTSPGVWSLYEESFSADPGTNVQAFATSVDPTWSDSDTASASYLNDPEALEIAVYTPKNPITYPEAGGPCEPGTYTPVVPVDPIEVTLPGGSEIPDIYEDSDQFQFYWTMDGSDPRSSNTRTKGITFQRGYKNNNGHGNNKSGIDISNPAWISKALESGDYTQDDIDKMIDDEMKPHDKFAYTIDEWDGASVLPVRVVALSKNPSLVTNSYVVSSNVVIEKITLRTPTIDNRTGSVRGDTVEINAEVNYGDMPVGARIYYTTDGSDPGDDGTGNPVQGTLYTGPFDPLVDADEDAGEALIVARIYPPVDYPEWFTVSPPSSTLYNVPTWDITGVATGWFNQDGTLSSRLDDANSGSYFTWNDALGTGSALFENISSRETFEIGELSYYNGGGRATGDVGSFDFSVQLDFNDAISQFDYQLNQFVTQNSGTVWENADMISFATNDSAQSVNMFGGDYYLNLEFGESTANGATTRDEFQVQEGELATAKLYGSLISLGSWW